MNKIAIIYSFNSHKTAQVAKKIEEAFDSKAVEKVNVEEINEKSFMQYDAMIVGVPTWFDGELPNYWDEFIPAMEELKLKGKSFAIFGLGDQKGYPENFCDGVGIMAELLQGLGGKVQGLTSNEGYEFERSRALKDEKTFYGLLLDQENQGRQTNKRVENWVAQLKKEWKV